MDIVQTLKTEYNKVLARWDKATSYLEEPERTNEEVEQWLPEYEAILKQRMALCNNIAEYSGVRPTLSEFENGFKIGGDTVEQGNCC